jgi:hypothetical protein
MLIIRKEQLAVMSSALEALFVSRVVAHLQRALPQVSNEMGDDAVRESVVRGMGKARGYGIFTESDAVRFVDFTYALSFDFDTEQEWAHKILTDTLVPAEMRLDMIDEYLNSLTAEPAATEDEDE